jgi:MSHA pilin protein MshC
MARKPRINFPGTLRNALSKNVLWRTAKGFTLIELVTVIVLLGILSVYVAPRIFDPGVFKERGFFDETQSALRYAQKLAVGSGCDVQVTLGAGGWLYILKQRTSCDDLESNFDQDVIHPSNSGIFAKELPGGVTVTPATILFTPRGQAANAARIPTDFSGLSVGGNVFKVNGESGYVERQ